MADVLFVVITVSFFAIAALFVRACERIIGPDEESSGDPSLVTSADQTSTTETTVVDAYRPVEPVR